MPDIELTQEQKSNYRDALMAIQFEIAEHEYEITQHEYAICEYEAVVQLKRERAHDLGSQLTEME